MKPTVWMILPAILLGYSLALVGALLESGVSVLGAWILSAPTTVVAMSELPKNSIIGRNMVVTWAIAVIIGMVAELSLSWAMWGGVAVAMSVAGWAWYISKKLIGVK